MRVLRRRPALPALGQPVRVRISDSSPPPACHPFRVSRSRSATRSASHGAESSSRRRASSLLSRAVELSVAEIAGRSCAGSCRDCGAQEFGSAALLRHVVGQGVGYGRRGRVFAMRCAALRLASGDASDGVRERRHPAPAGTVPYVPSSTCTEPRYLCIRPSSAGCSRVQSA